MKNILAPFLVLPLCSFAQISMQPAKERDFVAFDILKERQNAQVVCSYSKIKNGCLENVKQWLHSLEMERRDVDIIYFISSDYVC